MKKWKQTAGFTLVELIVVIAILGILAGVGTVGYSGYIKKANEAADNTLLSAVNTAFSAACIENGTNAAEVEDARLTGDDVITGVTGGDVTSDISEAFLKYFAGNANTALRSCTPDEVEYANGVFSLNPNNSIVRAEWNGLTLRLETADLNNIKNSNFVDDTGVGTLMGQVNAVVGIVQGMAENTATADLPFGVMTGTVASDDFLGFFATSLGVEKNELATMVSTNDYSALQDKGLDMSNSNLFANAMILYAAKNSDALETNEFSDLLSSGNADTVFSDLLNTFKTGAAMSGEDISKAACIYGMNLALDNYNSDHPEAQIADISAFMQTDAGKDNLAAYTSSMNVITGNLNKPSDTITILNNGIDDSLIDVLNQAMGIG